MTQSVTVYCSSSNAVGPAYHAAARELGLLLAQHGYTLIYGGSRAGLMGDVSDAAHAAGGTVVGVMPELFQAARQEHNHAIELIITDGMRARKTILEERADAFVALPGGFGTWDELIEVITNKQLGLHSKPIVLLNVADYYAPLLAQIDAAVREHFIQPRFRDLFVVATTPVAAVNYLAGVTTGAEDGDAAL